MKVMISASKQLWFAVTMGSQLTYTIHKVFTSEHKANVYVSEMNNKGEE